jgi:hypothetical protein
VLERFPDGSYRSELRWNRQACRSRARTLVLLGMRTSVMAMPGMILSPVVAETIYYMAEAAMIISLAMPVPIIWPEEPERMATMLMM